jgi:hypothetical protein
LFHCSDFGVGHTSKAPKGHGMGALQELATIERAASCFIYTYIRKVSEHRIVMAGMIDLMTHKAY